VLLRWGEQSANESVGGAAGQEQQLIVDCDALELLESDPTNWEVYTNETLTKRAIRFTETGGKW
jgi:hypothetical protein